MRKFFLPIIIQFTFIILPDFAQAQNIGLVARYPFDGNLEEIENGFDGEALGNIVYEDFFYNQGLRILDDGYNGVFLPNEVLNGAEDFTICTFIKLNGYNQNNNLISAANYTLDNEFIIGYNLIPDQLPNGWHFVIKGEKYFFENSDFLTAGKRYHLAFIREGNIARLVFDGSIIVDEVPVTDQTLNVSSGGLLVGLDQDCLGGCFQEDQNLDGLIDELMFFDQALTLEEINNYCIELITVSTDEVSNDEPEEKHLVYPNPFEDKIWIRASELKNEIQTVELFSLTGVKLYSSPINNSKNFIPLPEVSIGLYLLVLKDSKNGVVYKTLIAKK